MRVILSESVFVSTVADGVVIEGRWDAGDQDVPDAVADLLIRQGIAVLHPEQPAPVVDEGDVPPADPDPTDEPVVDPAPTKTRRS